MARAAARTTTRAGRGTSPARRRRQVTTYVTQPPTRPTATQASRPDASPKAPAALPELSNTNHRAAQHHAGGRAQRVEVGARVVGEREQVGGRALLDARPAEPAAGRPGSRGKCLLGAHPGTAQGQHLVDDPTVLDAAACVGAGVDGDP